jgi:polysaccharide deacetylase 2 family uncharacterized protein YibQ
MKKVYFIVLRNSLLNRIVIAALAVIFLLSFISTAHNLFTETEPVDSEQEESLAQPSEAKLSIIIDDFGSSNEGVEMMMGINRHLTFAIMPFMRFTNDNAIQAHEKGFEIIVHLPMEPVRGKRSWLGPNPILSGMDYEKAREIVKESIDNVPYAAGANIHMGSKASSEEEILSAVLDEIGGRDLYFVDSRTASKPIAKDIALKKNVICFERDVFLDGQQPKSFIKKRLREAGEIALKKGYAIAIGHVGIEGGDVTAESITEILPEFDRKNI